MKKLIVIILVLLTLGIGSYYLDDYIRNDDIKSTTKENKEVKKDNVIDAPKPDEYIDNNPIKLGLYKKYSQNRTLITEYSAPFSYHNDISSFEVFFTNDPSLSVKNFISLFGEIYNSYENISEYKIGYQIEFKINDQDIKKMIFSPQDTEEYFEYLELYLYDDYHQTRGVWYSHITENEMKDDSLLTSIKLTAGKRINEITSPITLSAFTYKSDDIKNNEYIGKSKYTIKVFRQ